MDTKAVRLSRVLFVSAISVVAISVLGARQAQACPAGGCTNASFYGDYSFSASGGGSSHVAVVGVLHADGAGNLTGNETVTDDSANPINAYNIYFCGSTYTVNSDGTGTASINAYLDAACTILGATPTVAFALEDGGHGLRVMNTNGSFVIQGTGRLQ